MSPPVRKPLRQRVFSWMWRRPWFRRRFYDLVGFVYRDARLWRTMNCGFLPSNGALLAGNVDGADPLGQELYAQLVAGTHLAGRDVLELGCGRGGGACFLHRVHRPRKLVALDYAPRTIRMCRRHYTQPGLEFVCGDGARPAFPEASFDVIVAVELTHCLADKHGFLEACARVLRPGGRLLIADFFYQRPDAMHAVAKFEAALAISPFEILEQTEWTREVIAAIEYDSDRRSTDIRRHVPRALQGVALGFASTTASSTYQALLSGRAVYRRYVLQAKGR